MNTHTLCQFAVLGFLLMSMVTPGGFAQEPTLTTPLLQIENPTASAVAWSPDGEQLAVGDTTGVNIYTRDLHFIRWLELPTEQMKTLAWSPDGTMLAAGGSNDVGRFNPDEPRQKAISVWETTDWEQLVQYDEHESYVTGIAWSPDSRLIATGSWDRTIRIWYPRSGYTEWILNAPAYANGGYSREVSSVDWSSDGHIVALVGAVGVFVWKEVWEIPHELVAIGPRRPPYPTSVSWSPDAESIALGRGLYVVAEESEAYFRNCPSGRVWSPDSNLVAVLSQSGMFVCNPFTDTVLARFEGGMGNVEIVFGYQDSLDWHPDGTQIAGAAGDGFVRIWDVSDLTSNP